MARLYGIASLFLFSGCVGGGMVRIPKTDPTPPAAMLEVRGPSLPVDLAVGGEPVRMEMRDNDSLVLTGKAEDEGGLKDMVLTGNALLTCSDPATGATFTKPTGFLRRHVPGGAGRGRAAVRRDSRFVLRAVDIARLCPGGSLKAAVGQAGVRAANFHGGAAATPRLEFRIAMSEVASQAIPLPAPARSAAAASGTGFAPEAGVGGSGDPPRAPAPRMCPRPGRDTGSRNPQGQCPASPVPSLSPPAEAAPAASPAAAPTGAPPPKGSASPSARAQRTQIPRI